VIGESLKIAATIVGLKFKSINSAPRRRVSSLLPSRPSKTNRMS